jgi:hypothetical protein
LQHFIISMTLLNMRKGRSTRSILPGNRYHDEVIDQFLSDYNDSVDIMSNLPQRYSFQYRPKIMQAYVAYKIKTQ